MDPCIRCGTGTTALEHGVAPLCLACDDELESEADQSLVVLFREAARSYPEDLRNLSTAAGGPDFETFQRLMRQCERSRVVCIELLGEMESRGSRGRRPSPLE